MFCLHGIQYGYSLGRSGNKPGNMVNLHIRHKSSMNSKQAINLVKATLGRPAEPWTDTFSEPSTIELATKNMVGRGIYSVLANIWNRVGYRQLYE